MENNIRKRTLTGTTDREEREYEKKHRRVAREAAAQGMVLLENRDGLLPLDREKPVALYGAGAVVTIKGGSGSGDVNARGTVSIWQGMKEAGFRITTEKWLSSYEEAYRAARLSWKADLLGRAGQMEGGIEGNAGLNFFQVYADNPFRIPAGSVPEKKEEGDEAETAVFVLSRTAGEGADRKNEPGDFLLTAEEQALLDAVCRLYEHVVLVLNTGGIMDLSFADEKENIDAILYIHQPGMEAGSAFADVLSGEVCPSGKLTDTWALSYEDYPSAKTYSYLGGNPEKEEYTDGIYVGYRYFDTFDRRCRYPFGYGLSYTRFEIQPLGIRAENLGTQDTVIKVNVKVSNTGNCSGREVVQLYGSCPQGKLEKEYRRLLAFGKTRLLSPGMYEEVELLFPLYSLASYDDTLPGYILEEGTYILTVGDSLEDTEVCGTVVARETLTIVRTENICPLKQDLQELKQGRHAFIAVRDRREAQIHVAGKLHRPVIAMGPGDVLPTVLHYDGAYDNTPEKVRKFVDGLSEDELIQLAAGDTAQGQGMNSKDGGNPGTLVPGAAAQTSACAEDRGLPAIALADGPAGLRLSQSYRLVDGVPQQASFLAALEGGFLQDENAEEQEGEVRYQYCTAFPTGTELAQSWDPELIREVGRAVGEELRLFHVTLWLAPGMNIHRNPLCGRNFEYYSEDPVLSGLCAAAMTEGVQSEAGAGTTIKHFACNNQEDNRMGRDSIVSERVLREIYLKGFEICIRKSQPYAVMTSYNLVNGVHAANSYDLCTKAARNEWGFQGVIMTDWTTTMHGPDCTASGCMRAGNDLIMPGAPSDHENMRKELKEGTLDIRDLKRSVSRLVNTVWRTGGRQQ